MLWCRALLVLTTAALTAASVLPQPQPVSFLMVKPGDPGATEERAKGFLQDFATYLGAHVASFENAPVVGHIANRRDRALRLLDETAPSLVVVPVGFYLEHLRDPKRAARVVASVPRFGAVVEHYYLVAIADGGPASLAALRGKTVRGAAEIDWPYLQRVVFPDGSTPPEHFALEPSPNLADDVFAMVERDDGDPAPDALLVDHALREFLADDDLVWPHLKVIWTSAALPRDLVVTLGDGWDDDRRRQLLAALTAMKDDEHGKRLLELMQSDGFAAPDLALLQSTAKAYDRELDPAREPPEKKRPPKQP